MLETTTAINKRTLRNRKSKLLLWFEFIALFVTIPTALRIWWQPRLVFALLFTITIAVAIWLWRNPNFDRRLFWQGVDRTIEIKQLQLILLRFLVCAPLMLALVFLLRPHNLFDLPRRMPLLWAAIMIFYPLLSVYPQELIYRTFFFERYHSLFASQILMILMSGAVFGFVHIIFQNPLAVLLTLIGGLFFAETYARTRSLRLVWLEHTLYGCLIFTVGLGGFFYHGRVGR